MSIMRNIFGFTGQFKLEVYKDFGAGVSNWEEIVLPVRYSTLVLKTLNLKPSISKFVGGRKSFENSNGIELVFSTNLITKGYLDVDKVRNLFLSINSLDDNDPKYRISPTGDENDFSYEGFIELDSKDEGFTTELNFIVRDKQLTLPPSLAYGSTTPPEFVPGGGGGGDPGAVYWDDILGKPSTFPPSAHNHNDLYYLKSEVDTLLTGYSPTSHNHDTLYYRKTEIDPHILITLSTETQYLKTGRFLEDIWIQRATVIGESGKAIRWGSNVGDSSTGAGVMSYRDVSGGSQQGLRFEVADASSLNPAHVALEIDSSKNAKFYGAVEVSGDLDMNGNDIVEGGKATFSNGYAFSILSEITTVGNDISLQVPGLTDGDIIIKGSDGIEKGYLGFDATGMILKNESGTKYFTNPTGTTDIQMSGNLDVSGQLTAGLGVFDNSTSLSLSVRRLGSVSGNAVGLEFQTDFITNAIYVDDVNGFRFRSQNNSVYDVRISPIGQLIARNESRNLSTVGVNIGTGYSSMDYRDSTAGRSGLHIYQRANGVDYSAAKMYLFDGANYHRVVDEGMSPNFSGDVLIDGQLTATSATINGVMNADEVISQGTGLMKLYSNEATYTDWRLTFNAQNAQNMKIYNFDEGLNAFGDIQLGGTGNVDGSGLQVFGNSNAKLFGELTLTEDLKLDENAVIKTIWNNGYGGAVQLLRNDVTTARWSRIGIVDSSGIFQGGLTINNDLSVVSTGGINAPNFNGVSLITAGSATNFLNEQGNYVSVSSGVQLGDSPTWTGNHKWSANVLTALNLENTAYVKTNILYKRAIQWNASDGLVGELGYIDTASTDFDINNVSGDIVLKPSGADVLRLNSSTSTFSNNVTLSKNDPLLYVNNTNVSGDSIFLMNTPTGRANTHRININGSREWEIDFVESNINYSAYDAGVFVRQVLSIGESLVTAWNLESTGTLDAGGDITTEGRFFGNSSFNIGITLKDINYLKSSNSYEKTINFTDSSDSIAFKFGFASNTDKDFTFDNSSTSDMVFKLDGSSVLKLNSAQNQTLLPLNLPGYTVATLPTTGITSMSIAHATDDANGDVPVYYDGTNWRRFSDNSISST